MMRIKRRQTTLQNQISGEKNCSTGVFSLILFLDAVTTSTSFLPVPFFILISKKIKETKVKKTALVEFLLPQKRLEQSVPVCLEFEIFYGHWKHDMAWKNLKKKIRQTEVVSSSEAFNLIRITIMTSWHHFVSTNLIWQGWSRELFMMWPGVLFYALEGLPTLKFWQRCQKYFWVEECFTFS